MSCTCSTLTPRQATLQTILKLLYDYFRVTYTLLQVATFETRFSQIKAARRYVEKKTQGAGENDLIIFAGDFNANGPTNIPKAKSYKE